VSDLAAYLAESLGHAPSDLKMFERAITHASATTDSYERLEFLGDRVLGLVIARRLYDRFDEPEGKLSKRLNVLVARETCADVGRKIGLPQWIRLGRQARDDRASDSDNIIGDVVEALIGALLLDGGLDAAAAFILREWEPLLEQHIRAPQHPKSALQELAAARNLKAPVYEVVSRTGAHHAPLFTVSVSVRGLGEASGEGTTKQDAETAAAEALLAQAG
jgi:ribonuclease-3